MSIVDKIKALCEKKDITLTELERNIEIGRGVIRKWDAVAPNSDKLQKVADYFDVSMDYLLGRDSYLNYLEQEFPEGIQVLRRATKELTPQAKAKMIKLMEAFLEEE
jgi:transcriptional regulator with XRE-family HTH domain